MSPAPWPVVGSRCRVGAVTIGQSPRSDITPDLRALLGTGVELVEEGALNGLDPEAIGQLRPGPGDSVLLSRLRDGNEVQLRKEALPTLIQAAIDRLNGQVELILLLCTGSLPHFRSGCPTLYPEELLLSAAGGLVGGSFDSFGVITPAEAQVEEQVARWSRATGLAPAVAACSPYTTDRVEERLSQAANRLKGLGAGLIVMDCLGYSQQMRHWVCEATGLPVLLARGVLGRVAAELLDRGEVQPR